MTKSIEEIPGPLGQSPKPSPIRLIQLIIYDALSTLPRVFDISTSLLLILILSPILLLRAFLAYSQVGVVFKRRKHLGYFQQEFERLSFAGPQTFQDLAILFNVLRGDLAWAGPRAILPEELSKLSAQALFRFGVRPGVVSAYTLRKKVGLAYDDELVTDHEFYYSSTVKEHVGVSLRGVMGSILGGSIPRKTPPILHFWGVDIVNTTMTEALDWVEHRVTNKQKSLLAYVNPDCLNIAYTNTAYLEVLQAADRVLPDGIGINVGCRMLNES